MNVHVHGQDAAFTMNTACTSAANALLYAGRLVASGAYGRALVMAPGVGDR